jgi:DNA-binding transcriptional MocR family regulator
MTMNMPPEPADPHCWTGWPRPRPRCCGHADLYKLLRYQDFGGTAQDRDAAVQWLRRRLSGITADQVLVAPGIHSVLAALVSQLARPGETICADSLVYPGLKAIATQLGVQLHPLRWTTTGPTSRRSSTPAARWASRPCTATRRC